MPKPRFVVYPYKMGSASAKLLAKELDAKRVYPDRDYRPKPDDVVVNWGSGFRPNWNDLLPEDQMINHWRNICYAVNKEESFARFARAGVIVPSLSHQRNTAIGWLEQGFSVIGRNTMEGTRGQGVVVMEKPSQFVNCMAYAKYEPTTKEFRVYTFNDKCIDALEKRRDSAMLAEGKINYFVRTEENGWVFCHNRVIVPPKVYEQAALAVKALGLIFGGVDVIWNEPKQRAVVLEVNTAPGIFGTTVSIYANHIQDYGAKLVA